MPQTPDLETAITAPLAPTNWELDFPGNTPLLTRLRERLTLADFHLRHASEALQQLLLELLDSGLPQHLWPSEIQAKLQHLQRQQLIADTSFARALANLQSAHQAHKANEKAKPAPEPVQEKTKPRPSYYRQFIKVKTVEGKTVATADIPTIRYWEGQPWEEDSMFYREFCFPDLQIPAEYAWVLTHEGITYEPTKFIRLYYSQEEFLRLCKLELDTNSDIFLEGQPVDTARND